MEANWNKLQNSWDIWVCHQGQWKGFSGYCFWNSPFSWIVCGSTADHSGFKFITYVLTILWHIYSLINMRSLHILHIFKVCKTIVSPSTWWGPFHKPPEVLHDSLQGSSPSFYPLLSSLRVPCAQCRPTPVLSGSNILTSSFLGCLIK